MNRKLDLVFCSLVHFKIKKYKKIVKIFLYKHLNLEFPLKSGKLQIIL